MYPDSVNTASAEGIRQDATSVSVSLGFMGIKSGETEQEVTWGFTMVWDVMPCLPSGFS